MADPSILPDTPPPAPPALRAGAIVLAAGASSRMGRPKQLLPYRGQPLVLHAVDALLASPVWPVVVVIGAHGEEVRAILRRRPVLIAENAAWAEGMASSVRTGIATVQQFSRSIDAVLVALCDQPGFTSEAVTALLAAQHTSGRGIAAARYNGRNAAPALFRREYFGALATLTGEHGARDLLNGQSDRVTSVDLPNLAQDLDTPEDYAAVPP